MNLTVILIIAIAIIAMLIWIIWDKKHKWETVYEAFGIQSKEIQLKYHYLLRQGIHCRLKSYTPATLSVKGVKGGYMPQQTTIQLQVNKKEIDQAYEHLADFNK